MQRQDTVSTEAESRPATVTSGASRTLIAAVLTILFWAAAFAGIREGLKGFSPFHVALLRYLTASIVLAVYALVTRMPLPRWRDLPALALLGLIGFTVYNALLNWGEVTVPSAVASFIIASGPIFIALLAVFFLGERLRFLGWLGILISFAGVSVIAFSNGSGFEFDPRAIVILIAAAAQAVYAVGQKPLLKRYTPVQFITYAIWFGTLFLLVFAPGLPDELRTAPSSALIACIFLGVCPGALGYGTWSYVLAHAPASRASTLLYVVPVGALVIAWVWLGEVPSLVAVIGGFIVLAGVILVNTLGRRKSTA
ncbi:MAG TPA: DMT family transporter [Phototrophicaceae bacterium]|nr:DMT family transporter [Phototrophicaceae bacterium]